MAARSKSKKVTPLMRQFAEMKAQHPDAVLLFRVGDFYETFGEDAERAAGILGITLTSRNNGGSDVALAGFPHHSLEVYLPKLVRAGYRVAVCDQLEKPSKERKVVRRGITELVTPGVAQGDTLLDHRRNNYLAAVVPEGGGGRFGVAFVDVSTGEFTAAEGNADYLDKLLQGLSPAEVVLPKGYRKAWRESYGESYYAYPLEDWIFDPAYGRGKLLDHFRVRSLKGFGIEDTPLAQAAAGAILHYLAQTHHTKLDHLSTLSRMLPDGYVWLDRFTVRNLELLAPSQAGGRALVDVLDGTATPMGARLLRRWLVLPLNRLAHIAARHDAVAALIAKERAATSLDERLGRVGDLERLAGKVATERANPRELRQLHRSLTTCGALRKVLATAEGALGELAARIDPCVELTDLIARTLREDVPVSIAKGNFIAPGVDEDLDGWRADVSGAQSLLDELRDRQAEATGISSLKVGVNSVFGYYFEVSNKYKNQGLTPEHWVRKQSLANAERYVSEELKRLEERITGAGEKIQAREEELFARLLAGCTGYLPRVQHSAAAVAELDCLSGFARLARRGRWVRPELDEGTALELVAARHPVIEAQLPPGEAFVPNDLALDREERQILMITGPNMSGKSAVLRQAAVAVIMAQIGSFVAADEARMGLVDKVFTRVGASDNISSGESTFMVEMNETASIMNNVSARSLVLLDEIGRGTSTFDGVSIAWAIAEYLHEHGDARPKTLFATHYHELNALSRRLDRVVNMHVATQEVGDRVIYLRKLVEGGTRHSFGIHVARMAGMPTAIVVRAGEVLAQLERHRLEQGIGSPDDGEAPTAPTIAPESIGAPVQLSIFEAGDPVAAEIRRGVEGLDVDQLTPVEAMRRVLEWRELLTR